ncbi:MAG: hypothetical protein ACWGQW_10525, partial [bacterium]
KTRPDSTERKSKAPKKPGGYRLTETEVLKFKNLKLQQELASREIDNLALQEELIARMVSQRVGEDVSRWKFDLQQAIVMRPPTTAMATPDNPAPFTQSVPQPKEVPNVQEVSPETTEGQT